MNTGYFWHILNYFFLSAVIISSNNSLSSSTKEFKCNIEFPGSIFVIAVAALPFVHVICGVRDSSVLTTAMELCKGYNKNLKYRKLFIFQYLLSVELGSGWHQVHFDNFKLVNASRSEIVFDIMQESSFV